MQNSLSAVADSIRGQNVLITGASGFVGSSLMRLGLLLNDNFNADLMLHLGVREPTELMKQLANVRSDIVLTKAVIGEKITLKNSVDVIFHCATPASAELNFSDPLAMFNLNLASANWIIEDLKLLENCPKVLFTSSGAIYGPQPVNLELIPETYTGGPDTTSSKSAYAEGKRVAEFLFSEAGRKGLLKPLLGRLFAFSGQGLPQNRHFALGNFVRDARTKNVITVRGSGLDVRSYLDSKDMAIWLFKMASLEDINSPLNIGSSSAISISSLAHKVQQRSEIVLKRKVEVEVLGEKNSLDGASYYVPSTFLAKTTLDVEEWTSIENSIDQMLSE